MSDAAAELAELRKQTIWEMLQASAARVPDRAALVGVDDDGNERRLTYAELVGQVREFSAGLAHIGVKRGDRIVLWMTNSLEWVIACFGAMRIGAAVVPINTFLKPDEIDYLIRQSGARHLVIIDTFRKLDMPGMLGELCPHFAALDRPGYVAGPEFPDLRNVVLLSCRGGSHPGTFDYRALQQIGRDDGAAIALAEEMTAATSSGDLGFVKYTSGSTSFPKGVMLQQGGIVANGILHSRRIGVVDTREQVVGPRHSAGAISEPAGQRNIEHTLGRRAGSARPIVSRGVEIAAHDVHDAALGTSLEPVDDIEQVSELMRTVRRPTGEV